MKPAETTTLLLCLLCAAATPAATAQTRAGLVETAVLYPGGHRIRAKLDTGALTTSLGVTRQRVFERGGVAFVGFAVRLEDGREAMFERPLVRTARIKEHEREATERPVVEMPICIGNVLRRTEVNLQDRGNFLYSLLVGRRFLAGAFAVDPAKRFLLEPACPSAEEVRE
jgi:hypothetical protein